MTDINTLTKNFLNAVPKSQEEIKAAYEMAGLAMELNIENLKMKALLLKLRAWDFQREINEESKLDG